MIKFGPFAPDVADYNVDTCVVADNCVPIPNGYGPMPAGAVRDSGYNCGNYAYACLGLLVIEQSFSGDYGHCMATYNASIEVEFYCNGNAFHKASLAAVAAHPHTNIVFVHWDTDLLVFGALTTPQKIAIDQLLIGNTSDIGGSVPQAYTAARIGQFLVLGYVGSNKYRVQWSAFDDYEGWTAGTDQSGFEDLDAPLGVVVQVVGGAEYGIAFQESGVTRMDYIGLPDVWEFSPIAAAPGLIAGMCAVRVGADIYYLSRSGFYVLRNGVEAIPIGANKVDAWFRRNAGLDHDSGFNERSAVDNISAGYNAGAHQVWWTFAGPDQPRAAGTKADVNNRVIIYDIKTGEFSTLTMDVQVMASAPLDLKDESGNRHFLDNGIAWVDHDGSNNTIYNASGTAMAATIETGHLFDEKGKTTVKNVRPIIDGTSTVTVLTKEQLPSDTEVATGPESLDADGKADFDVDGRFHRIRCITSGAWEKAVGVVADMFPTGTR